MANKTFRVNCWIRVGKIIEVNAETEEEVKEKASSDFEDEDLNRCVCLDSGCEIAL